MGSRTAQILDISGTFSETPDFPVAVVREAIESESSMEGKIVDPIFDFHITRNLFGRVMTLVEATTDMHKLSAVKDLFAKELRNWEGDVYASARELADGGGSSNNLYTKNNIN
jgi:hypothetical protein